MGVIPGSIKISLGDIQDSLESMDKDKKYIIDANQLNNNFVYLLSLIGNGGIAFGKTSERGTPTEIQLYWSTDEYQLMFFTNNVSIGDNGWIILGGA